MEIIMENFEPKNICLVSSQYFPHVGGVENYVHNLSATLAARGHKITIVTSMIEGCPEYECDGNVEIYRLPSIPFMGGRFPVLKHNKKLRAFKREFRERKFDIMLINMRFYFMSLYMAKLAKKMKLRSVLVDHGSSHLNTGGKLTSKLGEIFEHWISWREKRYCREFAGVSKTTLKWIEHFKIYSDTVLYNAIDADSFDSMCKSPSRDFRAEYNIPADSKLVSFVGRLTVEKGLECLVDAMKLVNEKRPEVHCLIAGDGYLREPLEKVKSENTHFVGALSKPDVAAMLSSADIFAFPSFSEGFSTVLLEASVAENYIVATERSVSREFIIDESYASVLPAADAKGFADAILEVLDDDERRAAAVKRCRDSVFEKFTWEKTADAVLALIDGEKVTENE